MQQEKTGTEKWVDLGGDLVEGYRKLITIKIVEYTSLGASVSIVGILLLVMVVFVLLFAGLGCAWWLGENMGNMKAGFFIVGGVYTLGLLVVLATSRKVLLPRIRDLIIKKIYEQD